MSISWFQTKGVTVSCAKFYCFVARVVLMDTLLKFGPSFLTLMSVNVFWIGVGPHLPLFVVMLRQ